VPEPMLGHGFFVPVCGAAPLEGAAGVAGAVGVVGAVFVLGVVVVLAAVLVLEGVAVVPVLVAAPAMPAPPAATAPVIMVALRTLEILMCSGPPLGGGCRWQVAVGALCCCPAILRGPAKSKASVV
jgi:hypothetical protein